jgi:L-methionine (R)-S-oxide reductase
MSESVQVQGTTREEKYQSLLPQIRSLVAGEPSRIANLANIMSALKYGMDFLWVGVYFAEGNELVLGPFQGPVACTRIAKGKGVCGTAFAQKKTVIVEDVDHFPGHIACSSLSRSEIVLPIFSKEGEVTMVLDVDSETLADFSEVDARYLGILTDMMAGF